MTNTELAQKALDVYADREHYTYVQGALFETSNSARVRNLYSYYRKVGNKSTCDYSEWLKTYGTASDGSYKKCTDCSNFIQALLGTGQNASTWAYANLPAEPDMYTAPVGCVLYMNGHVGLIVKQGVKNADGTFKVAPECVDFYAYNNTCRKADYRGALWTKAVRLNGVSYTNATVTPVSISASIKNDKYLGDTLTAADFLIKVTMSDGSVKTNPNNWSASPLKLTADVKNITVTYQNVSTKIPVKYKAEF